MELRCKDTSISLDRTVVMGVLNVTPDSFSDGGLWFESESATAHGVEMAAAGAGIIDVGGESTRPGSEPVGEEEELRRVVPVIEGLMSEVTVPISIDTRKASVARRAVEAGAAIINDTAGEESDRAIDRVALDTGAAIVVMHSRGMPATMQTLVDYDDVVSHVVEFLSGRADELVSSGVPEGAIVVDPGFGFAKTAEQNLILLKRFAEIVDIGYPVMAGTSRKSFIGKVLDLPEHERLEGTAATVAWAVAHGARLVRVHDVRAMVRIVRMTEAICRAEIAEPVVR